MGTSTAIQLQGLRKVYRQRNNGAIAAVQDLSLSVPAGQMFGFLGPNGAGKTTTIKMICGLVKPTAGTVWVNGHDVWRRRSAAMRQIGAVLEGTRNVHWTLSAWDNLLYFGHLKGMWGKVLSTRSEQWLRDLDLWDRRNDLVRTFSRGMQQKVALACALIADPPILLLDEPTLGLDVQAARAVKEIVRRLAREQGKTVVLTTHQLDMAEALCDRVAIISKGHVIADRPVGELLALFRTEYYRIRVQGSLSDVPALLLDQLGAEEENGNVTLSGPIQDHKTFYAILVRLGNAGLPLLSAARVEPNLEEIFVRLLDEDVGLPGGVQ